MAVSILLSFNRPYLPPIYFPPYITLHPSYETGTQDGFVLDSQVKHEDNDREGRPPVARNEQRVDLKVSVIVHAFDRG